MEKLARLLAAEFENSYPARCSRSKLKTKPYAIPLFFSDTYIIILIYSFYSYLYLPLYSTSNQPYYLPHHHTSYWYSTHIMILTYHNNTAHSSSLDAMLLESSLRRLRNRPPLNSLLRLPAPVQTVSKKHGRSSFSGISVTTAPVGVASDNSNSNLILDQNQDPKRQRRQAAATLVQNLPSWTGVGKKSKAQPRPQVQIPPKGIGPVTEPNQNDVLCGRGGRYMEFDERD